VTLFDDPPVHDFPDRAFRRSLLHTHNLRDVLRSAVPHLVDRLDCERATAVPRRFQLEDWRDREADLLFHIPYRADDGTWGTVVLCLLLEHQSTADPRLPLRILRYALLYWEQEWKEWENSHPEGQGLRLAPILPVVFHTGARPWGSNRTLAELIHGPEELRSLAPRWDVVFWDLAERTPEQLLGEPGEFLQLLSLVRAEAGDAATFQGVFGRLLTQLGPLAGRDRMRWRDLVWLAQSWVIQRRPAEERDVLREVARASVAEQELREEVEAVSETAVKTWAQIWQEQGEERGEERGVLEGLREAMRLQLTDHFGPLPEAVGQQIRECADAERLRAGVRLARTIETLDEFRL
jgi:hypothetical protein